MESTKSFPGAPPTLYIVFTLNFNECPICEIILSFNSKGLYSANAPLNVEPLNGRGVTPKLALWVKLIGLVPLSTNGSTTPFFLKFHPQPYPAGLELPPTSQSQIKFLFVVKIVK
jgi:hypothetical protein